jgi:Fur family ferric uptake transcriptional regulator
MTQAPHRPPLSFNTLDDIVAALRERGSRLSTARRLVLEALFAAEGPVSAEWIAGGEGGAGVALDVTSVYRNLTHLEELGVVRHFHLGHGPGLYALETESPKGYLVCERCDRIEIASGEDLDHVRDAVRDRFGYEARFDHFPVVGLCSDCAKADEHSHGAVTHSHPHSHAHEH